MPIYALVDCNNFYASCERAFNPSLEKKPILVLSNNDGCVIARSNEAKELGVPMCAPFFKIQKTCSQHDIKVFSANFELYGDMSGRVMSILAESVPDMEIYSIDEAFLDFSVLPKNELIHYGEQLRQKVKKWTGIPTSIGIAPTKVLAKAANHIAKKKASNGVFTLLDEGVRKEILSQFDIEEVWGIGRHSAEKLRTMGMRTAQNLVDADAGWVRDTLGVIGQRVQFELKGIPCSDVELAEPCQSIQSSRSFGRSVTKWEELEEAVSSYVAVASEKLRSQHSLARSLCVYIRTNEHHTRTIQYGNSASTTFDAPTNHTGKFISAGIKLLRSIYKENLAYKKVGVTLFNLVQESEVEPDLFQPANNLKNDVIMRTMDKLNQTLAKESLFFGSMGVSRKWKSRSNLKSPRYTTQWNELAKLKE